MTTPIAERVATPRRGFWGGPGLSLADYVAMTEAHVRGDRVRRIRSCWLRSSYALPPTRA